MSSSPKLALISDSEEELLMEGFGSDQERIIRESVPLDFDSSLERIRLMYQKQLIPEMELMDTSRDVLMAKVQYLDNVRKLAGQLTSEIPEQVQQCIALMEKIGRDMDLYQHFANQDLKLIDIVDTIEDEVGLIESDILTSPSLGEHSASRRGSIDTSRRLSLEPRARRVVSKQSLRTVPSLATMNQQDGALSSIPPSPSGIFKWTLFRHLTILIGRPGFQKFGSFTCFAIASGIAVGTNTSVILVFDLSQNLKCHLGDVQQKSLFGAVTCISISPDYSQLLAGYQNGYVCLWDIKKKVLVKQITPLADPTVKDAHRKTVPISMVSLPCRDVFFTADEDGAAFYHVILNRMLYYDVKSSRIHGKVKSPQELLNSKTTILSLNSPAIEAIRFPGDSNFLVAITSPYKLAIVAMKPIPQILYRISWSQLIGDGEDVKVDSSETAWYIPSKQQRADYILLAVSFASHLRIVKIEWNADGGTKKKLLFDIIAKVSTNSDITSVHWMTSKFVVVTTATQEVQVFNSNNLELVEKTPLKPHRLSSDATWRDTEKQIYHHNINVFRNRLFIISQKEMWFASLLTWQDRLGVFVRVGNFERAFQIGVSLFQGKYPVAVLGVPQDENERKSAVADHVGGLLINLVAMTLSGYDKEESDLGQYHYICKLVTDTAMDLEQSQLIYGEIWDRFAEVGLESVYLHCLQEFIFQGKITYIPNPDIVNRMFDVIEPLVLEQVIIQLDPEYLDIHNCLDLCRRKGLVKAMIYIYNSTLSDYVSPLLEMMSRIEANNLTKDEDVYTLFVYLAYILQGKAFPFGVLDAKNAKIAYHSVFSLLCAPKHQEFPNVASPIRDQGPVTVGMEPWPYFQYLLQLDAVELIKTFGAIFQNSALDSGIDLANPSQIEPLLITRQYILSILLRVLELGTWSQLQTDTIHAFIGRSFFHYRTYITLSKAQLMDVFNSLLNSELTSTKHDREVALLCMYKAGFSPFRADSDREAYLSRFKSCNFWQVYEFHVLKEQRFDLAIDSYLHDSTRKSDLIGSLSRWLSEPELAQTERELIQTHFLDQIAEIVDNGLPIPEFVEAYLGGIHLEVLKRLKRFPEKKYVYMTGLLHSEKEKEIKTPKFGIDIYHQYFELMCRLNPSSIRPFLEYCERSLNTLPFNLDYVENLCQQNQVNDGVIWALVQKKSYDQALPLIIRDLLSKTSHVPLTIDEKQLETLLQDAYMICEKAKDDSYWVDLLTDFCFKLSPQSEFLSGIQKNVIEKVSLVISIPEILIHLLNSKHDQSLGVNKTLVHHLLSTLSHQKTTKDFASRLASRHLFYQFKNLSECSRASFHTPLGQCQICRRLLHVRAMTIEQQKDNLIMFKCKHAFHFQCLKDTLEKVQRRIGMPGSVEDYESWCVVCGNPSKKRRKGKAAQLLTSVTDLTLDNGDSLRIFKEKVSKINACAYPNRATTAILKQLLPRTQSFYKDEIELNDTFESFF